jgi:hypothetical protein
MKARSYFTAVMLFVMACLPSLRAQNWLINGNGNTTAGTNFLGTTNNQSLAFRTNNIERMRLTNNGNFVIGQTSTSGAKFQVATGSPLSLSAAGYAVIGKTNGFNLGFDTGIIQARNNGVASPLFLNYYGGDTIAGPGGVLSISPSGTTVRSGNFSFTSGTQSIQFANPSIGVSPAPMMFMFSSGTANTTRMVLAHSPGFPTWGLQYADSGDQFDFLGAGTSRMSINLSNGNVGIGVTSPAYRLEVCGTIRAKEVRVETGWCDYVFEKDYKLRTVDELDKYINENKHLPGIASAKEVETEGLNVGEMNKAMMEKIEELTLYVIQLSKDNKRLQEQIDALKK